MKLYSMCSILNYIFSCHLVLGGPVTTSSKSSNTGIIAGAAAGGAALLVLVLVLLFYALHWKKKSVKATRKNNPFGMIIV